MSDFWDKVREKAYLNYLNRINNNISGSPEQDWVNAEIDQRIEERINEEAYFHYLKHGDYPLLNWAVAKNEIMYRIQFLAFYQHESNINRSAVENWKEAEKLYLERF